MDIVVFHFMHEEAAKVMLVKDEGRLPEQWALYLASTQPPLLKVDFMATGKFPPAELKVVDFEPPERKTTKLFTGGSA